MKMLIIKGVCNSCWGSHSVLSFIWNRNTRTTLETNYCPHNNFLSHGSVYETGLAVCKLIHLSSL